MIKAESWLRGSKAAQVRIAVGGAGLLVVTEIALRALFGLGNPPLVSADPDLGYYFQPNQDVVRFGKQIHYNEHGLRSRSITAAPVAGVLRVLCIGDSVTNGGAATDQALTYPAQLEQELLHCGVRAEVLNASAGGWAPANELAFVRSRGTFYSHVAILQIGTHDLCQPKATSEAVGTFEFPEQRPRCALAELPRYLPRLRSVFSSGPVLESAGCPETTKLGCARDIEALVSEVVKRGAKPGILLTPNASELPTADEASDLRQNLFRIAKAYNVPVEDLLPSFRAAAGLGRSVFRDSVHPNATGNSIMAAGAARLVRKIVAHGPGF